LVSDLRRQEGLPARSRQISQVDFSQESLPFRSYYPLSEGGVQELQQSYAGDDWIEGFLKQAKEDHSYNTKITVHLGTDQIPSSSRKLCC
jgi:hypothetical protein